VRLKTEVQSETREMKDSLAEKRKKIAREEDARTIAT
jgi:hypothetical protein